MGLMNCKAKYPETFKKREQWRPGRINSEVLEITNGISSYIVGKEIVTRKTFLCIVKSFEKIWLK